MRREREREAKRKEAISAKLASASITENWAEQKLVEQWDSL